MKPLGTITKYYSFIDEETKSILNSLMAESNSYFDFVQRLSDVVLKKDAPLNLAYLAAGQAWWSRIEETMGLIQEKYKDVPYLECEVLNDYGLAFEAAGEYDLAISSHLE